MVQARLSRPEAVVALIPAYNPDRLLVGLVEALRERGFSRIIVVDDGSSPAASPAFEGVRHVSGCTLLRHERNRGKGRALKTGLAHLLECCPEAEGVVTVDADGQHEARDVMRVAETFLEDPAAFVIGSRCFTRGTPLRSRLGNLFTRAVFRRATGVRLADTQSGLRCFSRAVARRLLSLAGERYEYEMNVLAECARAKLRFREVGIETLYFDGNRSSHFNPALDSMRICLLLLRSSLWSLLAALVDLLVFAAVWHAARSILVGTIAGRVATASLNLLVNGGAVFHGGERGPRTLLWHAAPVVCLGTLSYLAIRGLAAVGLAVLPAKVLAETALFLTGFGLRRDHSSTTRHEGVRVSGDLEGK